MTILSDKQIEKLCIPAKEFFDHEKYDRMIAEQNKEGWPLLTMSSSEIFRVFEKECRRPFTAEEELANKEKCMIVPFVNKNIREKHPPSSAGTAEGAEPSRILSYGLSSYGYDVRLAKELKLFTNINSHIIDPKRMDDRCLVDAEILMDSDGSEYVILPPNCYLLGKTIEVFNIPRDVMVICLGKSTLARAGAIVNTTPIEPGFKGVVVIEISNSTNLPLKIYVEEGIAQFLFFRGEEECRVSYADRAGKYQGQMNLQLSKV